MDYIHKTSGVLLKIETGDIGSWQGLAVRKADADAADG
jgi:hypothetical protein